MANLLMSRVFGSPYAAEVSGTLSSAATETAGIDYMIPTSVGVVAVGITRQSGTGKYKMQVTFSTRSEIESETAIWYDWEVAGIDANGFIDADTTVLNMPVPSGFRFVMDAGEGTSIYYGVRAN